ncbi:MAG: 23S rRNA (pseudouridine(1915)-N(3))-methyltransferase RlmH [Proteobacteria bacterium]|nr:23S rRNA (pseudouridine(1915)-N(3))-methyltransferase RlmH [Pseudomonadota bacterium]
MKLTLATIGRLKESYLVEAEDEYRKRMRAYCTFAVVEHKDEAALLAALPANVHLFAFDERGEAMSSREFAAVIGAEELHGGGAPVVFAIGGADGHSEVVRKRARRSIAFGKLTIAHRLVRVIAIEQLYRAYTILRGEPYHRD